MRTNAKVRSLADVKRQLLRPGLLGTVVAMAHLNRRRGNCWVTVDLEGAAGNTIARCKLPASWLDPVEEGSS